MSLVSLQEALPDVLPELPDCPKPMAIHQLLSAAIEFCEQTLVWRETLDPFSVYAGIGDYDVVTPQDADVVEISAVYYQNVALPFIARARLDAEDPTWRTRSGTPSGYTLEGSSRIVLVPKPEADTANAVAVLATLRPTRTATQVPGWFMRDWRPAIAAKAKTNLMLMGNKPWSDPASASTYYNIWRSYIGDARVKAATGGSGAPMRTRGYHK